MRVLRRCLGIAAFGGAIFVFGCGGGGGGLGNADGSTDGGVTDGGDTDGSTSGLFKPEGTAQFNVNVETGEVQIMSLDRASRSIFSGGTIAFNSSTLLDEGGAPGRRVLNVSMTNKSGEPIGTNLSGHDSGIRVYFTSIEYIDAGADLRTLTTVNTLSGSGLVAFQDGPVGSARFAGPEGIAVSPDGTIYVADTGNHRIRKIANGQVSTLAGSGVSGGKNGFGVAATFASPGDIAIGPDGNLFVTELSGNRIRRVTPQGSVSTVAGTGATGTANGGGQVATFNRPDGIAVSWDGTIYVADSSNNRIRKIIGPTGSPTVPNSYSVSHLAGSGVAGFGDGVGTAAIFKSPRGVAVAPDGTLYVSDHLNNRIRRVSPSGEVVTILGGSTASTVDGDGKTARFNKPTGLVVTPDNNLLIYDSRGRRIRQAVLGTGQAPGSPTSWRVRTIAGAGTLGHTDGQGDTAEFSAGAHVDLQNGQLIVMDSEVNAIRTVTSSAGLPIPDEGGVNTPEKVALANPDGYKNANEIDNLHKHKLDTPYLLYDQALEPNESTLERTWQFIVPEGVKAFRFTVLVQASTGLLATLDARTATSPTSAGSPENMVRTIAGRGLGGHVNGTAWTSKFSNANGLSADEFGAVYVADTNNHAIRRIDPDGTVSTILNPAATAGSTDGFGNSARLNGPRGVACTRDGRTLYITDSNNHTIRRAVFFGSDRKRSDHWSITTIAGLVGAGTYAEGAGPTARFNFPVGVAVTSGGMVYVSEFSGNRIRRLASSGDASVAANWQTALVAGSSVNPVGTAGSTDGFGTSARFDLPAHIALDAAENLYVADVNNSRIRKIDPDTDTTTVAGSTFGYTDGIGTAAQFGQPNGVTVDPSGYIYVADTSFHRIRRISPTGLVQTVSGTGNTFPERDGPGDLNFHYFPLGICFGPDGILYVVDGGTYGFEGGGGVTSPGLRVKAIERIRRK